MNQKTRRPLHHVYTCFYTELRSDASDDEMDDTMLWAMLYDPLEFGLRFNSARVYVPVNLALSWIH